MLVDLFIIDLTPSILVTLPETNIASENGWLDATCLWEGLFSGAMLVLGSVLMCKL